MTPTTAARTPGGEPPCEAGWAPPGLRELPAWVMGRLADRTRSATLRRLARHDLRLVHHAILEAADALPDPTQRTLADAVGVDTSNMVHALDELAERGLVVREARADDRRCNRVRITAAGRRELRWCREQAGAANREFLARLPAADRRALVAVLGVLAEEHGIVAPRG